MLIQSTNYYKLLNITNNYQKNINEYIERYKRIDDFEHTLIIINTRYDTFKALKDIYQQILIVDNKEYIINNFKQSLIKQDYVLSRKIYEFFTEFDREKIN